MSIEISARGGRISAAQWDAIQALPKEELPSLTPEQKQVAQEMRVREEDYARSSLASKREVENSLEKAVRFARFLKERIKQRAGGATLRRVSLDDPSGRFEVDVQVDGRTFQFRVMEKIVDDLFESGSELAESRLNRILDLAFETRP